MRVGGGGKLISVYLRSMVQINVDLLYLTSMSLPKLSQLCRWLNCWLIEQQIKQVDIVHVLSLSLQHV